MGKFKKSQILILTLIVILLSITPFLSSSIKSTHLYFIINILIIAVGAESGLLSAFTKPPDQEKKPITANPVQIDSITAAAKIVKESNIEKISTETSGGPSIFSVGSEDMEGDDVFKDEDSVGDMAGQELSTKAETFISNFYNQLKMQREMS